MSASDSTSNHLSLTSEEEDLILAFIHGGGSPSDQYPTNDNAQMSFHTHSSSTFEPARAPNGVFSDSQPASSIPVDHQHHQTGFQQYDYSMQAEQAMPTAPAMPNLPTTPGIPTMQATSREGVPSVYTQFTGGAVPPLPFPFPMVNQGGWFPSQPVPPAQPGVYQNDGSHIPDVHGGGPSNWTPRHTEILREGKQAGKTVQEITDELFALDGIYRSTNCISKRWGRMRESCVPKHERDSIVHNVTPRILRLVYDELANLERARMLNTTGQWASVEGAVMEIARRHMERCVQDIVLRIFGNETAL